jgi:hypothetical protein
MDNVKSKSVPSPLLVFSLSLFIVSIPFYGFSFLNVGQMGVLRPDWIFGGVLMLLVFLGILAQRQQIRIDTIAKKLFLFNMIILGSFGACWYRGNCNLFDFLTSWFQLIFVSFLYLAIANMSFSKPRIRTIFKVWLGISFLVALYAVYQVLARNLGWGFAFLRLTNPSIAVAGMRSGVFGGYVRPSSILTEPTYLGAYLLPPTVLLAMISLYRKDNEFFFSSWIINRIILLTLAAALVLSFALASYVTIGFFLAIGFFYKPVRSKLIRVLPAALVLLVVLVLVLHQVDINFLGITERFTETIQGLSSKGLAGIGNSSIGVRLAGAIAAVSLWTKAPFLGVGLNQFGPHLAGYAPSWYGFPAERLVGINSVWPKLLVETGISGLVAFLLLWLAALRSVLRHIRHSTGGSRVLLVALFCVLLTDVIGSSFNLPYTHPQRWFDLGLASIVVGYVKQL